MRVGAMIVLVVSLSHGLAGCCEQRGCDAMGTVATPVEVEQGIAGIAAYHTDDGDRSGCFECDFAVEEIEVFETDELVTEETAADAIAVSTAIPVTIDEKFELSLAAGPYLVCRAPACAAFLVEEKVTTVNVLTTFGPITIRTFSPAGEEGPASFEVERSE